MIELNKDLLDTFNSVNFDDYMSSSEFEKNRDQSKLEKELEEAFSSVNFEEYKVPITGCNSRCSCNKKSYEDYATYDNIVRIINELFNTEIVDRGEEYYGSGKVLEVIRDKNTFFAKVLGHDEQVYDVIVDFFSANGFEISCNCPCDFNCKHEYAVLAAIINHEYTEVELKESIEPRDAGINEMLERIPAEDFKNYCLNDGNEYVALEENHFKDYFKKYLPTQSYIYYYNNLYNSLCLKNDSSYLLNKYYENMKDYIECGSFKEVIKILRAIIDAYVDSNSLSTIEFINVIRDITMFYRVTYNNVSNFEKNELEKWIFEISSKNYYNNYYLKDMILSIR